MEINCRKETTSININGRIKSYCLLANVGKQQLLDHLKVILKVVGAIVFSNNKAKKSEVGLKQEGFMMFGIIWFVDEARSEFKLWWRLKV